MAMSLMTLLASSRSDSATKVRSSMITAATDHLQYLIRTEQIDDNFFWTK